ncbi:MAG: ABC transporter ATP-binding protein, partial [Deltaproteobacteria bacterium]
ITGLPQSLATLLVLSVELITSDAWLVLAGGAGLFVTSRLLSDRASRQVGRARRELQNADAAVFGNLQETLSATEDLRLWGARGQAVREFAEVAHSCARARSKFAAALAVSGQIKSVFTAMAPLLIVVALKLSGRTYDAGEVAKLLLLVPLLMVRLAAIDAIRQGLIEREPLLRAAQRLLDLEPAPPRAGDAIRLVADAVTGHITFTHVSFTPPGAAAPVIDDVSLDIPAGSVVGICGPSGSGKSSLLRLLLRLDDPERGSIELDGEDLTRVEPDQLPSLFGVVRQTSRLLQRPIRDNLAVGLDPPPDDDQMRAALRAVQMSELADDEQGRSLATAYRANPPNFSGGECRRLLLARMLVGPSRVCLLDEPEAGLPGGTAEEILRTVTAQAQERTHLVVTHAPHLLGSDFNVVLDAGKVVAVGPHDELVDTCECYRDLLADSLTSDSLIESDD